jgi:hypothetical protein
MASARAQLEELTKPNPRYVLELHTIRGMIQEADNIDKSLRTVLGIRPGPMMASVPQPPPQPTPTIPTQFVRPTTPTGTQWDEPASSPEEQMSDPEDFFDDGVRIPMDKLRI